MYRRTRARHNLAGSALLRGGVVALRKVEPIGAGASHLGKRVLRKAAVSSTHLGRMVRLVAGGAVLRSVVKGRRSGHRLRRRGHMAGLAVAAGHEGRRAAHRLAAGGEVRVGVGAHGLIGDCRRRLPSQVVLGLGSLAVERSRARRQRVGLVVSEANLGTRSWHDTTAAAGRARVAGAAFFNGVHARGRGVLELLTPVSLGPSLARLVGAETGNVEDLEVAVALVLGHGEHQRALIQGAGNQLAGAAVEAERVPGGEEEAKEHLEASNHGVRLRHDEDKTLSGRGRVGVDANITLNLDKSRGVNESSSLRVDTISGVGVCNGSNRHSLLLLLALDLGVVKLDVALEVGDSAAVVGGALLEVLLHFDVLLLVGGGDDAPAAAPGNASAKADSNPGFRLEPSALHDDVDVVERLALTGNQSAGVGLLQDRELVHCQADAGGPLNERVVRVEVQKVAVLASSGNAEDVLQRLLISGAGRQRFDLRLHVSTFMRFQRPD